MWFRGAGGGGVTYKAPPPSPVHVVALVVTGAPVHGAGVVPRRVAAVAVALLHVVPRGPGRLPPVVLPPEGRGVRGGGGGGGGGRGRAVPLLLALPAGGGGDGCLEEVQRRPMAELEHYGDTDGV